MRKIIAPLLIFLSTIAASFAGDLTLWYRQPIGNGADRFMNEALPIGNGRIGGLIAGGVAEENVVLDEDSLWTGDANPSGDYGKMGAYQTLGNLLVHLQGVEKFSDYRRDLDIGDAVAHVSYESGGVRYSREYFCSHADGVMVVRFTADKPGSYTGSVELKDSHGAQSVAAKNRIVFAGALANGMKYEAQLTVVNDGGSVQANGAALEYKNCNSLTFIFTAGTDYVMDYAKNYRGDDPHARVVRLAEAAAGKSYAALKAAHEKDFHALFDRVALDLGKSSPEQMAMPTDQRKIAAANTVDPGLETLLFQYGRYLLIACSRPGGLPANLQGLWNDSNNPPWSSDYHANINIEMNYWLAEAANLSECHQPFFDLAMSQIPAWRKAAAASPDLKTPSGGMTTRGWAIRTSHNTQGGMGWRWDKTANAWYCRHFWEHYAFTGDVEFLKSAAYPVMKETCEFWEDHLKTLPDGRVVVPDAWSPEHGPVEDGVSYSQEIVWDLFNNYVKAADALGVDPDYRDKIANLRDRLAVPGIGSWGQLLEWMTEKHDPRSPELDTRNDHHRHTSHLFAVYPGEQISVLKTPALATAAKVSLDARGDTGDVREWSFAWRTALYARLRDGEAAHRELQQLLSARNTCPNLFGLHPPMQIDGNFGITAGMCEMLVQSHEGGIHLLPALPKTWPEGSVKGLCARGGFEVDIAWRGGQLTQAVIRSAKDQVCRVSYGGKMVVLKIANGKPVTLDWGLNPLNAQSPTPSTARHISVMQAGKWRGEYDLDHGVVDLFFDGKPVIARAFAAVRMPEMVTSADYKTHRMTHTAIQDSFGNGEKYTVESTGGSKRTMVQNFWFYNATGFFMTEVEMVDKAGISSNYMSPLTSHTPVTLLPDGGNRVLGVPFDNDQWVRYDAAPFGGAELSNEVSAFYNNAGREGLVVGSVEHDTWKTGVQSTTSGGAITDLEIFGGAASGRTRDVMPHGKVSGTSIKSPRIFAGFFSDWRDGLEAYAKANAAVAPPRAWKGGAPFGWNSWGKLQFKLTFEKAVQVSDFFAKELPDFKNDGVAYMGLDSGWDAFSDAQLKEFVDHCHANHQEAGIYFTPFTSWTDDGNRKAGETAYQYKDLFLLANGKLQKVDGGVALDPTHPGTRQMIETSIRRFKQAGFKYLKLDFLTHGTLEADRHYDPQVTTGMQAYNAGMKFVEQTAGTEMYLNESISPLFPAQYANSRRIACDSFGRIDETEYMLNSLSYGWWLDRVYDFNDADHIVLDGHSEGENRARVTSSAITGIFISGDDFSDAGSVDGKERAKKFLGNAGIEAVARMRKSFRPVEGDTGDHACNLFSCEADGHFYLAVFNYSWSGASYRIDPERVGLKTGGFVRWKELWSGATGGVSNPLAVTVGAGDAALYEFYKTGDASGEASLK